MKNLWAPWRMKFVKSVHKLNRNKCIFCSMLKSPVKNDKKNHLVYRGKNAFIILNIYPYSNGHLMVIPKRHIADFTLLTVPEFTEMFTLLQRCIKSLKKIYRPDGFNIGLNLGKSAGAGIDKHLHIHLVPRWSGDINFMPVINETKVLPELLDATYTKLKNTLKLL